MHRLSCNEIIPVFRYWVSSCLRGDHHGTTLRQFNLFLFSCSHLVVSMLMCKQFIGTPTLLLYLMTGFSIQTSYLRRHISPPFWMKNQCLHHYQTNVCLLYKTLFDISSTYVAVLGRNRMLFCCVFRSRYHVRRPELLLRAGVSMHHCCVYDPRPYSASNGIMFDFYPGLPH